MNWRLCQARAGFEAAIVVSVACLVTGLMFARGVAWGETPMGQRHELHPPSQDLSAEASAEAEAAAVNPWRNARRVPAEALAKAGCFGGFRRSSCGCHGCDTVGLHPAAVVEETRLAARLRAPVTPNDDDARDKPGYLRRARVFLAAGDFRRALDACLFHLWEQPSVESYVYLTYVYHAIDGYMEHLAAQDRWVAVEHLFLNLAARGADDLIDPPDVLARMAKEIMHGALQKQADVTAAMAARLDRETVNRLWTEQAAWRTARPDDWWAGVPDAWGW